MGLRELLAKATKGPWKVYDAPLRPNFPTRIIEIQSDDPTPIVAWGGFDDSNRKPDKHKANAALIVAAINSLPALCDCVEALVASNGLLKIWANKMDIYGADKVAQALDQQIAANQAALAALKEELNVTVSQQQR